MSQIYKEMNKSGKYAFLFGSFMALVGVIGSIIDNNTIWPCSLAVGLYYIGMASWDSRMNASYVKKEVKT